MDILNWLHIKKQQLIRTTLDSPKDLVILGADVSFQKRGDKYQSYAIPAEDFLATARPYKVYTALLTQTGTDAPVATVLENTLGVNISYQYGSVGQYLIISDNPIFLSSGKVYVQFQLWADDSGSPRFGISRWLDSVTLEMIVNSVSGSSDGIGDPPNTGTGRFLTSIEIRVYN